MRKIGINLALGLVIYLFVAACSVAIAFLFRDPFTSPGFGQQIDSINIEYLIACVPVLLITLAFAWISRTRTKAEAWQKSIVWTIIIALIDIAFAVINSVDLGVFVQSSLYEIFINTLACYGYYIVLAAAFAGPLFYARLKRLQ